MTLLLFISVNLYCPGSTVRSLSIGNDLHSDSEPGNLQIQNVIRIRKSTTSYQKIIAL